MYELWHHVLFRQLFKNRSPHVQNYSFLNHGLLNKLWKHLSPHHLSHFKCVNFIHLLMGKRKFKWGTAEQSITCICLTVIWQVALFEWSSEHWRNSIFFPCTKRFKIFTFKNSIKQMWLKFSLKIKLKHCFSFLPLHPL